MKLIINYDLMNQIRMANTGFNLKRFTTKLGLYSGIVGTLSLPSLIIGKEIEPIQFIPGTIFAICLYGGSEFILKDLNKRQAESNLTDIASQLEKINVYTSATLLKGATSYKTQYKIEKKEENKAPSIIQNKFITVPTTGYMNNDEVSLQQEHEMGSKEYVLSIGEPKKARTLSLVKTLYKTAANK